MAAEYFLAKGFRHFGYFGSGQARFSLEREAGFRHTLRRRGLELSACHAEYLPMPPFDLDWRLLDTTIGRWLQQSPKPLALLASHDLMARLVSDECQRLGIAVPGEVAILGVDNDEYECRLARPLLSSIALPAEEIGFMAVQILDQLMRGKRPRHLHPAPGPLHVVSRQSTDHYAVADPVVQRALQFIREQGDRSLRVEDVRRHCAVSRRILERRFQSALQQSPLQAIHRACVERAKPLLQGTRLDLGTVAAQSGFSSERQMADIFRKAAGSSPSAYRKREAGG
jgi:LacI family transcriptional regulator